MFEFTYYLFSEDVTDTETALSHVTFDETQIAYIDRSNSENTYFRALQLRALYGSPRTKDPAWVTLMTDVGFPEPEFETFQHSMVLLLLIQFEVAENSNGSSPLGERTILDADKGARIQRRAISRIVAVTAGSGWHWVDKSAVEPSFGKNVVLNWSVDGQLTELNTEQPGARGKQVHERLNSPGKVHDFAVFDDLFSVTRIGSRVNDRGKARTIAGGRSVRFMGAPKLDAVVNICQTLLERFYDDESRPQEFGEIETAEEVRSAEVKEHVLGMLWKELAESDNADVAVCLAEDPTDSTPAMIRFKKPGERSWQPYLQMVSWETDFALSVIQDNLSGFQQFRDAQVVWVQDADINSPACYRVVGSESLWSQLSYVSRPDGRYRWIISSGRVLRVSEALHERLNRRMDTLPVSPISLPVFDRVIDREQDYRGIWVASEKKYNERLGHSNELMITNLDRSADRIKIGGSPLEMCDLFLDGRLICVKRGITAEKVSDVCQQVRDAAASLEAYPSYWPEMEKRLTHKFPSDPRRNPEAFTFTIALISNRKILAPRDLTLKAKLAINTCMREVFSRRFALEIIFIGEARK